MSGPALDAQGLTLVYGSGEAAVRALDGVDFQVSAGEILALMGPSGSGKTTLLMILGGLLHPTAGAVRVEGRAIAGLPSRELAQLRLQRMGFIFQSYNLFPALTAMENVQVALELKGRALGEATGLLDRVGLGARLHNFPKQLSGGEKQRVAIARALAGDPPILLADEPTAALDSVNGRAVVRLLGDLAHGQGRAVVVVTHDPRVGELADRVVRIEDGRIQDSD
ncbi:ABC transporter ATP-binding protein [Candidatus Thiodictyon syntrophicum]|jgi:putative ABC transport system ATP-binding protein|uniref:ABC transporter ATP-binding protein n=1 Tax=Candidatus Thiodictyon syntrophicum TaxID=1166950 RepID=A0A2K8U5V3_9GAMM|nr:ABC transporter ATP-binding protein [Candidatus Thiodictyon syntrophicum]AUB80937.1 ABC transporter ATP-binding protein [Candidatus Thiodictyon syntrophicum]